jgi:hypothetical protein
LAMVRDTSMKYSSQVGRMYCVSGSEVIVVIFENR